MNKVIVIVPDANIGTRLCEYLNTKYGITATLWPDIQGIEDAQADAYIIYRKCVDDLRALDRIDGKVALLYGKASIPTADKFVTYPKLVGNLPECVDEFIETLLNSKGGYLGGDLTWNEDGRSEKKQKSSLSTWSPVRSVALFHPAVVSVKRLLLSILQNWQNRLKLMSV